MSGRAPATAPSRRRAVAIGLAILAMLLFTWPFVRSPPLGLVPAYLHLVGAWALVVVLLAVLARALRAPRERPGWRDD